MRTEITIDSSDREPSSASVTDFKVKLDRQINRVRSITLKETQISNAWHLIRAGVNDTLDIDQGGVVTVTVPPGNYSTAASLATALQTAINATALNNFTVTFDPVTFFYTITDTDTVNFDIKNTSTILSILGFSGTETGAATYTATNAANLSTGEYILLKSNFLTLALENPPVTNKLMSNVFCKIPMPVGGGGVAFYQPSIPMTYDYGSARTFDTIDIQMTFKDGEVINNHGMTSSFHFIVDHE